jgi:hypothetical protein
MRANLTLLDTMVVSLQSRAKKEMIPSKTNQNQKTKYIFSLIIF